MWKEKISRAFNGIQWEMVNIRDRQFHVFGFVILDHDINNMEDFGKVIDHLIDL